MQLLGKLSLDHLVMFLPLEQPQYQVSTLPCLLKCNQMILTLVDGGEGNKMI